MYFEQQHVHDIPMTRQTTLVPRYFQSEAVTCMSLYKFLFDIIKSATIPTHDFKNSMPNTVMVAYFSYRNFIGSKISPTAKALKSFGVVNSIPARPRQLITNISIFSAIFDKFETHGFNNKDVEFTAVFSFLGESFFSSFLGLGFGGVFLNPVYNVEVRYTHNIITYFYLISIKQM